MGLRAERLSFQSICPIAVSASMVLAIVPSETVSAPFTYPVAIGLSHERPLSVLQGPRQEQALPGSGLAISSFQLLHRLPRERQQLEAMKSPREILSRIEHLVARASSPEQEEARTSAQLAVSMMRQYGVKLSLGDDHVVASSAPEPKNEARKSSVSPSRTPRPVSNKPTIIVYLCSGCARVVLRPGLCVACIEARAAVGIWNVTCDGCGRQAPGASKVERAHDVARVMGYVVTDDDRTLCPACAAKENPWQRAAP